MRSKAIFACVALAMMATAGLSQTIRAGSANAASI